MATKKKPSDFKALMLRTCNADMSAHGGFVWPTSGYVIALDWSPEPVCGAEAAWAAAEVAKIDLVTIAKKAQQVQ